MTGGALRIGVVDDDSSVGRALRRLLCASGFAASEFLSAEDFIAEADTQQFDCLVLDVTMPEMDGFALRDYLYARGIQIPVVFITAMTASDRPDATPQCQSATFLRKPFEDEDLLRAIRETLALPSGT